MDPTKLPTDSLYKFLAIGGLVVAFGSGYALIREIGQLEARIDETGLQVALIEGEYDLLDRAVGRAESALVDASGSPRRLTRVEEDAMVKRANDLRETFDRLYLARVRAAATAKADKVAITRLRSTLNLATAAVFVGTLTSGIGFVLWYTRLQRPLDHSLLSSEPTE